MNGSTLAAFWSSDFYEFAKQVVWFGSIEREGEKYPFLAFLMARGPRSAYDHARRVFDFTDEDFQEALGRAKPGLFIYPERWASWNQELGIEPPLPFPVKWPERFTEEHYIAVQMPAELHKAFTLAVEGEKSTVAAVIAEMMQEYINRAEEKKSPLYMANEAIAAGNIDEAVELLKQVPVPPELADVLKDVYGLEFLLEEGFNLSEVREKYGEAWFTDER